MMKELMKQPRELGGMSHFICFTALLNNSFGVCVFSTLQHVLRSYMTLLISLLYKKYI